MVDNVEVGSMSDGEIYGELAALILNQKKCNYYLNDTYRISEIDKNGLDRIIESASADTKKMIIQLCEALSKREEFQKVPFSESDLMSNLDPENELITKLADRFFTDLTILHLT